MFYVVSPDALFGVDVLGFVFRWFAFAFGFEVGFLSGTARAAELYSSNRNVESIKTITAHLFCQAFMFKGL